MKTWGDSRDSHDDGVLGRTYLYPVERANLERKRLLRHLLRVAAVLFVVGYVVCAAVWL